MDGAIMALTVDQVKRIKAMRHDDLAAVVEASLRLHRTTILNIALIFLTIVLIGVTWCLVYPATEVR
jgi:hypothetical protein